jgi:hypothetical protein
MCLLNRVHQMTRRVPVCRWWSQSGSGGKCCLLPSRRHWHEQLVCPLQPQLDGQWRPAGRAAGGDSSSDYTDVVHYVRLLLEFWALQGMSSLDAAAGLAALPGVDQTGLLAKVQNQQYLRKLEEKLVSLESELGVTERWDRSSPAWQVGC